MKRKSNKKTYNFVVAMILVLGLFFSIGNSVGAKSFLTEYRYDYNTIGGYKTNYHGYVYLNLPANATRVDSGVYKIGGGWNYNRYKVFYNYVYR